MDKIKINFVSQGNAYLASHRLRVQRPTELINVGIEGMEATTERTAIPDADVNVFSKHFDMEGNLQAVLNKTYYAIFDVCDDHFDNEELSEYYKTMCDSVDLVTCNTERMETRVKKYTKTKTLYIPDPVTFPKVEPKDIQGLPKLLWFDDCAFCE